MSERVTVSTSQDELYIFIKGKLKGTICTADFAYGHTIMFDLDDNFLFDYNGGFFDGDNYLRLVGKIIKPEYQRQELRYVNVGKKMSLKEWTKFNL